MSMIGAGKRLVILGGGISGLSYAHYLRNFLAFYRKGTSISKVTLVEANNYMGGSIKSIICDDSIHEQGPRMVRFDGAKGYNTLALIEQLGLGDSLLKVTKSHTHSFKRYVYINGKFWLIPPSNLTSLLKKLPASDTRLLDACVTDLFKRDKMDLDKYPYDDPPVYDFFEHRFGKDCAENVFDPLYRGITSGDVRQLSTKAMVGDLLATERVRGSVLKGNFYPPTKRLSHDEMYPHDVLESKFLDRMQKENFAMFNLTNGLQTLPEHLCNSLLNTNDDNVIAIYNQTKVKEIYFNDRYSDKAPCSVAVQTIDGDILTIEADHIISTLPAKDFAKVLPETMAPEHKKALKFIHEIPCRPVGCVTIQYKDKDNLPPEVNSFGFLTHSKAGSRLLGVSMDSAVIPQHDAREGLFRMTCMLGGDWYKEVFGTEDLDQVTNAQLEQIALEEVAKILGIKDEPHKMTTILWKTGISQFRPGHVDRLKETREMIEKMKLPLTLIGQSYDGHSVNDAIWFSRQAASEFVKSL